MQSPLACVKILQSSMIIEFFCICTGLTGANKSESFAHPKRFGVIPGEDELSAHMRNLGGTS